MASKKIIIHGEGSVSFDKEDLNKLPKNVEIHIFEPNISSSNDDGSTAIYDRNGKRYKHD